MSEPTVAAIAPDGTPIRVPAAQARAVVDGGGHVMSPEEEKRVTHRLDLEEKYSGVEGAVAPFAAGAARGLTLGGSDVALSRLGAQVRQRLLDYQEYDPVGSAGGEIAGIAGGALLGDEAGLASLPNAVGRLGTGVGEVVAGGLGRGIAARALGGAAGGAAEGAIYAAGKAESDAALHNEDLTAEQVVASGVHGAAFGGALGLGTGLLGGVASRFAGAGRVADEEAGSIGGMRAPRAQAEAGSARESFGETLQKGADVKTIKALGGSAGDLRALERNTPGGFRKVAQDIQGDIEQSTGKSIGFHNRESLHDYATQRVDELGASLGKQLQKLDESGAGIAPDVKSFAQKVREELIAPNVVTDATGARFIKPGKAEAVSAAESWLKETEGYFGAKPPTFKAWQESRVGLDKQINFAARQASPAQETLRDIRGIMEKELETSGEVAAQQMGTAFADHYQATKSLYQSVRKAQELTERGVAAELARNSFGLGATIGSAAGLATGGPVTSVAMGLAGKLVKDRGDMLAADLLGRAADLLGVSRAAARTNARMNAGVAGLVGGKIPGALASPKGATGGFFSELLKGAGTAAKSTAVGTVATQRGAYAKHAEAVAALSSNPAALSDRVGKMLGPMATNAPHVTQAATGIALRGLSLMASKMPPSRQDPFTLQPQFQPTTRASDSEISRHMRYVEAIDNPTMVLDEARKGTLTRDHVEAVKAVYPKLYAEMQQQVMRSLVTSKSELPYGRRIQLGILLDIPTDKTLSPDFQTAIQATYSSAESAGAESPPPSPAQSQQLASGLQTGVESAMFGGLGK